jgi:hypothetical protein
MEAVWGVQLNNQNPHRTWRQARWRFLILIFDVEMHRLLVNKDNDSVFESPVQNGKELTM